MARPLLIRTSEYPYNITGRANNKEWFYLNEKACWDLFCRVLADTQEKHNLDVHAFLMMGNHFHLMASTPNENIDKAMHHFMTSTSKTIGAMTNRINRIWGARYYRSVIQSPENYAHAFKYLYANPIRAGMVEHIEYYPFSTFKNEHFKNSRLVVSQREGFDIYVPDHALELSRWINRKEDQYYTEQVRRSLKKSIFKFSNKEGVKEYDYFKDFLPKK